MDFRAIIAFINIFCLTLTNGHYLSTNVDFLRKKRQTSSKGCALPNKPSNGNWNLLGGGNMKTGDNVPINSILQFKCNNGYKLSSANSFVACIEDVWNAEIPSCLRLCPTMHSDDITKVSCYDNKNIEIKCSEATNGSFAKYECAPYYESSDRSNRRYCVRDVWNLPPPQCFPICGEKRISAVPLIVNGQPVQRGEYPWVTAIFMKIDETGEFINLCGGTMLNQKVILTVAHCVTSNSGEVLSADKFKIAVGKYFNKFGDPRDIEAQYSEVEKVLVHRKYKGETQRYSSDIAFLITKDTLVFSKVVQPICYRNLDAITPVVGDLGIVTGWGYTNPDGNVSDVLQEMTVPYKDEKTCVRELPTDWADKYLTYDKFCAGIYNKSTAICRGDTGNGLVFKYTDGRYYIYGIASLGRSDHGVCDTQISSLYTRVGTHYEWLEQVTAEYKPTPSFSGCTVPSHPAHGKWFLPDRTTANFTAFDKVAANTILEYECNIGYKLSEEYSSITCRQDGDWNREYPFCVKRCSNLVSDNITQVSCYNTNNQKIECSEATDGCYVTYECAPYYESFDPEKRRNCVNGIWDSGSPQCLPVCGEKTVTAVPLVVHGQKVKRGNYPWTTALYIKDDDTGEFINSCGGTMLTQRVILTAAHCVTNDYGEPKTPDNFKIAVGKYFNRYEDSRDRDAQYSDIESILVHKKYTADSQRYSSDIAFLITKNKLSFSNVVQPACFKNLQTISPAVNELGIVAGWGNTKADDDPADEIQEVLVPFKDDVQCATEFPQEWARKYLTYDKFCAGYYNKSKAVCLGDSGSGLVFQNKDGRYYVHGIVSIARQVNDGCDIQRSALYTRVSTHYEWLLQIVTEYS